jgi:hypothetical protein
MTTIYSSDVESIINDFSVTHTQRLQKLLTNNVYFDKSFIEHALETLSTFSLYMSVESTNDLYKFNKELKEAQALSNDYDSYGEYCYDMLKNAFTATNDCLNANAVLKNDLAKVLDFDRSMFNIASHYISYDIMKQEHLCH